MSGSLYLPFVKAGHDMEHHLSFPSAAFHASVPAAADNPDIAAFWCPEGQAR
ncbi:MAG: hypothetical protein KGS44_14565 [Alphaproteobacteria bacterium]|nr:hypothetical protein [Alphaproteobacteria bacterium]